jgi:L-threonylcarbamoyladenylate synthase
MQIIKQNECNIDEIVKDLKDGKTIVYPTETCYGLGCDATNATAVEKVFKIKKRQKEKSVLVLVHDIGVIMDSIVWNETLNSLAERYWPGPLTVVAKVGATDFFPAGVVAEDNTLAFRVTNHPLASVMCRKLKNPIVSTSANISAQESPYDIADVLDMYSEADIQPDIIIDAGILPDHSPSTVVRVVGERIEVLRQGEIVIS